MSSENNVSEQKAWLFASLAEQAAAALRKRGLNAFAVPDMATARQKILELIPEGATVGWGDSVTLFQTGVCEELRRARPSLVTDAFEVARDGKYLRRTRERLELMRKAAQAEVFLSGTNAVTLDGRLVSIDGVGNRVAPTIFGPKRVIMVAGANKIVRNLDEALYRARQAAVLNVRRHIDKHGFSALENLPCARKGACADCYSPMRICRYTVIIEGEMPPHMGEPPRINVVLIGQELGL